MLMVTNKTIHSRKHQDGFAKMGERKIRRLLKLLSTHSKGHGGLEWLTWATPALSHDPIFLN